MTEGQHIDKREGMKKDKKILKLDCHYVLDLEGSLKNPLHYPCCQRYSAPLTYELCDLVKLIMQCLSFLICRMGVITVLNTLECCKEYVCEHHLQHIDQ